MSGRRVVVSLVGVFLLTSLPALAFYEDLCLPRNRTQPKLTWCLTPNCLNPPANASRACAEQIADFATVQPGWSMIHADSTYFLAQALAYSRAEIYQSGIVTLPLQQTNTIARLTTMNAALGKYAATVRAKSANPAAFSPLVPMPGNSIDPLDKNACWK